MMHDLEKIFGEFRLIAGGKRGGDKIKILEIHSNSFSDDLRSRTLTLTKFLSDMTGWSFVNEKWAMDDLEVTHLKKDIIPVGKLNGTNYSAILRKNPISFAITGTKQIEYTKSNNLF